MQQAAPLNNEKTKHISVKLVRLFYNVTYRRSARRISSCVLLRWPWRLFSIQTVIHFFMKYSCDGLDVSCIKFLRWFSEGLFEITALLISWILRLYFELTAEIWLEMRAGVCGDVLKPETTTTPQN